MIKKIDTKQFEMFSLKRKKSKKILSYENIYINADGSYFSND